MSRSSKIKSLRPSVEVADTSVSSSEIFQNEVLRPILKLQNDLIISWFEFQIQGHKLILKDNPREKIKRLLSKNNKLQAELKGIIIGQFTLLEYKEFTTNAKDLGKRIIDMAIERFLSQR